MQLRSLVASALLVAPLAACAPESPVGTLEADATEEDAVSGDVVYVVTRQDFRKCAYPMCGGVYVKAVNKTKTTCLDGTKAAECYVGDIDLTALELSEEQTAEVRNEAIAGNVLLSGELAALTGTPIDGIAKVKAYKAFEEVTGNAITGSYYTLSPSGITCIKAPCPSLHANKLNSTVVKQITDVDFSALGLSDDEISAFVSAIWEKNLVVTGTIKTKNSSIGTQKIFKVSEVFSTVEAVSAPALCLNDDACGEGQFCDMSVCHSNCAPDMVCPAVCWGECAAGEPAPAGDSCVDACGGTSADGSCYCDDVCSYYGDCCSDYTATCE